MSTQVDQSVCEEEAVVSPSPVTEEAPKGIPVFHVESSLDEIKALIAKDKNVRIPARIWDEETHAMKIVHLTMNLGEEEEPTTNEQVSVDTQSENLMDKNIRSQDEETQTPKRVKVVEEGEDKVVDETIEVVKEEIK